MLGSICGTGSYIPSHRMDNVELSSLVDTSDEWIRERTGIQSRHLAKQETVSFMAAKAKTQESDIDTFFGKENFDNLPSKKRNAQKSKGKGRKKSDNK